MRKQNKKIQNGFTLIELMVVIVIIGILVAIALPNFVGATKRAKIAGVKANARVLQTLVETYAVDWGGFYPGSPEAITSLEGYKSFSNPFTMASGLASTTGVGAWRTNNDGAADQPDNSLIDYAGESDRSQGLVLYVGMDQNLDATTRFNGDGRVGSNLTSSYFIFGCDDEGHSIPRFALSNGEQPTAVKRLLGF